MDARRSEEAPVSPEETAEVEVLPSHVQAALDVMGGAALVKAAARVPSGLWYMPYVELEAMVKPSRVAIDLRNAFWQAANQVLAGHRGRIQLTDLAQAARCTYTHAYQLLTGRPELLAWLLSPMKDHALEFQLALRDLLGQFREIIDLPLLDQKGRVIMKNARLKLQAFKFLDEQYGPYSRKRG